MSIVSKLFVKCETCNRQMECDLSFLPNVYVFVCSCGHNVNVQVIGRGDKN